MYNGVRLLNDTLWLLVGVILQVNGMYKVGCAALLGHKNGSTTRLPCVNYPCTGNCCLLSWVLCKACVLDPNWQWPVNGSLWLSTIIIDECVVVAY